MIWRNERDSAAYYYQALDLLGNEDLNQLYSLNMKGTAIADLSVSPCQLRNVRSIAV